MCSKYFPFASIGMSPHFILPLAYADIGVRGSPERLISSLRAFGPGGGQIWRVVRVSARAPFEVLPEKIVLLKVFHDFAQDVQ